MTKVLPALAALLLLAVAQVALGAGSAGRPRVALEDVSPVTVVGAGFPAREAVVVTVQGADLSLRKTVRSTAAGAFTAGWNRSVTLGRCGSFLLVTARGANGTRAVWKPVVAKDCPPPKDP